MVQDRPLPDDLLLSRDTSRSLPMALLRAREAVMAGFRPLLARHNVTEQQWRVIRVLGEAGRIDAGDLADRACILAPSLTRILRALEDRGIVARSKDGTDARRTLVEITPVGAELIRTVSPESRKVYAALERELGRDRIESLLDLLSEINATLTPSGSREGS